MSTAPQALTDLCWALASFGFTPTDAWFQRLELEIAGRCAEGGQPPEGVSEAVPASPANVSNSAGTLQVERLGAQGGLLQGYAADPNSVSGAGSRMLTPQQLAVVLWALQSFKWVPRRREFVEAAQGMMLGV